MALKYAQIFVTGHYLFQTGNGFPTAKLEENRKHRGKNNVQQQIYELLFALNRGFFVYYPSNILQRA